MASAAGRRLLYLTTVWPEYRASAAGVRSWQLIELFKARGWDVACSSAAKDTPYRGLIEEEKGVRTFDVALNSDEALERLFERFTPDVVLFERFNLEEAFSWRVRHLLPEAVRIIDTQDLNSLRQERETLLLERLQEGAQSGRELIEQLVDISLGSSSDLVQREIAAIHRSDGAFIVSTHELDLLTQKLLVPPHKLELAPFFYGLPPETKGWADRKHFATIGNFRHRPNADSARWLAHEIWPRVRSALEQMGQKDVLMHVYGSYPTKQDMELTNKDIGFVVKGPAKDQFRTLQKYRVLLAPLRFGAGIKGKIADSWWCGAPVVTTPIGAEGMGYARRMAEQWGGVVGWTVEEMCHGAVDLYTDETRWDDLTRRGRAILHERFSLESVGDQVVDFVERLTTDKKTLREKDVIQAILWREQHRSTQFFGKYIEQKGAARQA